MGFRNVPTRPRWVAVLLAALGGCQGPDLGTIRGERRETQGPDRDGATPTSTPPNATGKRPDFNDLSPRARGGGSRP